MSSDSVPILDCSLLSSPETRPNFISQLRNALINVGFLYLSNTSVSQPIISSLADHYLPALFGLPLEEKLKLRMANSPHFMGYSPLGAELTEGTVDRREVFDFGTKCECPWKEGKPEYLKLWGPSQWPDEALIPGFRETLETYLDQVQAMIYEFTSIMAEAFNIPSEVMMKLYGKPGDVQGRAKVVRYPLADGDGQIGIAPHCDAGFITFLLQVTRHPGLQVQNLTGDWVDVPPIPGTFVLNIGRALEFLTQGLAKATSHRVLSPRADPANGITGPRYSIAFFQSVALDVRLSESVLEIPNEILELGRKRGSFTQTKYFAEFDREPAGQHTLRRRMKAHPHIAQQHYPEIYKELFLTA